MKLSASAIGYVGADAEMEYTGSGVARTRFNVATTYGSGDNKATTWVRVTVFGKLAETVEQYVKKGMLVEASGRLTVGTYQTKGGETRVSVDLTANEVYFLSRVDSANGPSDDIDEDALF